MQEDKGAIENIGDVTWCKTPPRHVFESVHKFTILDAIEHASTLLRTNYAEDSETIVIGFPMRSYLVTLPQYTEESAPKEEKGLVLAGMLGRRRVMLNYASSADAEFYLTNGKKRCNIKIIEIDYTVYVRRALELFEQARAINPYLFFELAWSKQTGWCSWLIDKTGGERKVLANRQIDEEEPDTSIPGKVCVPVVEALEKWLLEKTLTVP